MKGKKKKWLASLLAAVMVLTMAPCVAFAAEDSGESAEQEPQAALTEESSQDEESGAAVSIAETEIEPVESTYELDVQESNGAVAAIGNTSYTTLADAIKAASTNATTITLTANTSEDVVIPAGANITLEISNGVILSNAGGDTITNNGTLTVTGVGTVTNTSNGKTALLNNGTAYLNGGNFSRTDSEGNSYYTVVNHGTMTVAGANISNSNTLASCLENGWNNTADVNGQTAKLTISSGTITGGMHAVKNDEGGALTISGGTITGNKVYTVLNYGTAEISGGTITNTSSTTGTAAVSNGYYDSSQKITYPGTMTITGGTFSGSYAVSNDSNMTIANGDLNGTSSALCTGIGSTTLISGGDFDGAKYYGITAKGDVTITGGDFTGGSNSSACAVRTGNANEVVIEGGNFDAGSGEYTIYQGNKNSIITIEDGSFTGGTKGNIKMYSGAATDSIEVSGGTFSAAVSEEYCADGFDPVQNSDGSYSVDEHELVAVEAKAATCTEAGHEAYWKCSACGKMYSDATGSTEITEPVNIPAVGHSYGTDWKSDNTNHWHECSACGDKTGVAAHTMKWIVDKEATATEKGSRHEECTVCGYKSASVEIPATGTETIKYKIIEGANSSWRQNSDGTLTFRANGDFDKFTGVKVDGKLIDKKNYTAKSGSTVITLKNSYLKTLSEGTHTLTVVYTDGECSTNFTVKAATTALQTGDTGNLGLWAALLAISAFGIGVMLLYGRKRNAR